MAVRALSMSKQWIPLQRTAQLEEIRQASFDKPVVIFKHSTTCSISQMALGRWERSWQAQPGTPLEAYFLDLRQFRDVSNAVAATFDVPHESPQVLLVRDGKAVLDRSHYDIRFEDVAEAIKN